GMAERCRKPPDVAWRRGHGDADLDRRTLSTAHAAGVAGSEEPDIWVGDGNVQHGTGRGVVRPILRRIGRAAVVGEHLAPCRWTRFAPAFSCARLIRPTWSPIDCELRASLAYAHANIRP